MLTAVAILDELLDAHAVVLGRDFTAYRNHAYRVVNLCVAQSSGDPEQLEKSVIVAAFHDMGIWTDGTEIHEGLSRLEGARVQSAPF